MMIQEKKCGGEEEDNANDSYPNVDDDEDEKMRMLMTMPRMMMIMMWRIPMTEPNTIRLA